MTHLLLRQGEGRRARYIEGCGSAWSLSHISRGERGAELRVIVLERKEGSLVVQ